MKVATRRKEQDAPAGGAPAAEAAEAEAAESEAADAPQQQENEAEGGAELQVEKRKLIKKALGEYSKLVSSEQMLLELEADMEGQDTFLKVACSWATKLAPKMAFKMHGESRESTLSIRAFKLNGYSEDDVQLSMLRADKDNKVTVDMVKLETLSQEKVIAEGIVSKLSKEGSGDSSIDGLLKKLKKARIQAQAKETRDKEKAAAKAAAKAKAAATAAERARAKEESRNKEKAVNLASAVASELKRVTMLQESRALPSEANDALTAVVADLSSAQLQLDSAHKTGEDLAEVIASVTDQLKVQKALANNAVAKRK